MPTHGAAKVVISGSKEMQNVAAFGHVKIASSGTVARAFQLRKVDWLRELHAECVPFARAEAVALSAPVLLRDGACIVVLLLADIEAHTHSKVDVADGTNFVRLVCDPYAQHVAGENSSISGVGAS